MKLIICIHNHQPVGNMDSILEEAYTRAYLPFFQVLQDFHDIKINLHFSGSLFRWLQRTKPDYIDLLKRLQRKGQVEIISGGMYEPVLSLLSEEDSCTQIRTHLDLMEEAFGVRPKSMWLAERVYEPHLPTVLTKAGISHTLVDDNHFRAVGLSDEDLYGYFVTEHGGNRLSVFPGLELLRYAIPYKPLVALDQYLKEVAKKGGDLVTFGDDGEKFGLWPGTYQHVYEQGWLSGFFTYLIENRDWLRTTTFSEYLSDQPAKGLIYLDCQSYKEMGAWCLPAALSNHYGDCINEGSGKAKALVKGGYFKHFLVKYPESNDMHKKMLAVTDRANEDAKAKNHVLMAQCNDSYWHGVFGGLYLPHLRASIYRHLIEAEKILDPDQPFVAGSIEDINLDGEDEAILSNKCLTAYFLLREGGALYELDHKPSGTNIMASLSRRYEAYHDKIRKASVTDIADGTKTIHDMILAKEEGLENYLHYDWYRRASLIDHVMDKGVRWDLFYRSTYVEPGDFVKERYRAHLEVKEESAVLTMKRNGHFWKGEEGVPLFIEKTIQVNREEDKNTLVIDYRIDGDVGVPFLLGVEFNLSFLGTGGDRYMETESDRLPLTASGVLEASRRVLFHDPYQGVDSLLEFDRPSSLWTFPVEVISLSETGFERNYQSTMCMPVWEIDLSGGPKHISMRLQVNGIDSHNNIQ